MLEKQETEPVTKLASKRKFVGQSGLRTPSVSCIPPKSNFPVSLGRVGEQTINSAETMKG